MKKQQDQTKGKKADDKDGNKGMNLQERRQRYVAKISSLCSIYSIAANSFRVNGSFSKATY